MRDPIRVLIADDHPVFRDGLRVLLEATADTTLVGQAVSGDEVVRLAATLEPDVILMDLKMPGINGIEATRQIVQTRPQIGVLVITMFEDDNSVFAAMRAGARGYLLKGADKNEILLAIRAVSGGEAIFGPAIAHRLAQYFTVPARATGTLPAQVFPDLTDREREILALIGAGRNNREIADHLVLSLKTVRNYVSNIFSKLQVNDRAQAIVRARETNFAGDRENG